MTDELEIPWVQADANPWGVAVLDVRPVTLGMVSTSSDPEIAANALGYGAEDGRSFAGMAARLERTVDAALVFPTDGGLADGVLFVPQVMEDKWAVFVVDGRILFVRSWLRKVWVTAEVRRDGETAVVGPIHGAFLDEEEPELTVRIVDFLLRTHALGEAWPAPLPPGLDQDPQAAALWCMSMFGRRAVAATHHPLPRRLPHSPLRTHAPLRPAQ
jgi:hypothetical protein